MRNRRPRHDRGHDPRPTTPGMPWQTPEAVADAELGARLESALREGPGSGHVDVAQLLRGTRRATTKRARTRRTALIAATAVAVGAVPVGLQTARWMSTPPTAPASGGLATGTEPTPSPSGRPSARPTPSAPPPRTSPTSRFGKPVGSDPNTVLYEIPDSVAFDRADLPLPMSLSLDLGQYRGIPTVQGQVCNEARFRKLEQPVAGRAWSWAVDPAGRLDEYQIDLNVTGWSSERSAQEQIALVRRDAGACRFDERVSSVISTSGEWTAVGYRVDGVPRVYAASVVAGGLVVGVTVTSSGTRDATLKTANALVKDAVRNLEQSGLTKELALRLQASGRRATLPNAPEATAPPGDDPYAVDKPTAADE